MTLPAAASYFEDPRISAVNQQLIAVIYDSGDYVRGTFTR
jgi:hypothetical protein